MPLDFRANAANCGCDTADNRQVADRVSKEITGQACADKNKHVFIHTMICVVCCGLVKLPCLRHLAGADGLFIKPLTAKPTATPASAMPAIFSQVFILMFVVCCLLKPTANGEEKEKRANVKTF